MKRFRTLILAVAILAFGCAFMVPTVDADSMTKKIVVFHEDVTDSQRMQYAADWATKGVTVVMDLPFMNAMVIMVPDAVKGEDLARDLRVKQLQDDQKIRTGIQSVAAGDGGSGDGGSGDGGSGDGGSGDGGSGDGGSGDGGSVMLPTFIKPFRTLQVDEYPWGTIAAYDLKYEPTELVYEMDDDDIEDVSEILVETLDDLDDYHIRVAILDTGVDVTHSRLRNAIKGGFDVVNMQPCIPADDNGHGTHVAGTLAGYELGVAPGADLYMVKVLDAKAEGDISNLVMGLQWAVSNQIHVVSMSLAYKENNDIVRLAVQRATEEGIILVAAVGNHFNWEDNDAQSGDGGSSVIGAGDGGSGDGGSGDGGSGDGGSGDGGSGDGGSGDGGSGDGGSTDVVTEDKVEPYTVLYPAKYPEVIAVSAHDAYGMEPDFVNVGPETILWAPGVDIVSTVFGDGYGSASGTSMAVPHVTGTIALMLAVEPSLSPEVVQKILMVSSDSGQLNTKNAVEMTHRYAYSTLSIQPEKVTTDPVATTTLVQPVAVK